jgi:hypothetical protein
MYSELPFEQHIQDEDLAEQFAAYTTSDLRSSLLKLIQTNVVYSYCESLIIEEIDCTELEIAEILDCCKDKDRSSLQTQLPFKVLLELKRVKDELKQGDWDREQIIGSILNLVVENTLLYSSLARFAYS